MIWDIRVQKALGRFSLNVDFQSLSPRCAIIGQSGTGKSLLLKTIAGLLTPDTGHICINGAALDGLNTAQRRIGYLFQDYALFPHLSVAQQIAFSQHRGWRNPRRQKSLTAEVQYWLEALDIAHLANHYPAQLSGGQQQRTALARILITHPNALLLDEPFSALDTTLRSQMRELISSWQQKLNIPLLIITHDPEDAQYFGDDLLEMRRTDGCGSLHRIEHPTPAAIARILDITTASTPPDNSVLRQIDTLNNRAGISLFESHNGGRRLSGHGKIHAANLEQALARYQRFASQLPPQQLEALMTYLLQTSIRNQLLGKITAIAAGAVNSEIQLQIGSGQTLTAIISKHSADTLQLTEGQNILALINASDVMVATESLAASLSARNQLQGSIARIDSGAVNDEIIIDLGEGSSLAATITKTSAENLALSAGKSVYAIIKAPNIMLARVSA